MIVGCYSMDLYCDGANFDEHESRSGYALQVTGQTEGQCVKEARQYGWVVNRRAGKAYCPECKEKR